MDRETSFSVLSFRNTLSFFFFFLNFFSFLIIIQSVKVIMLKIIKK